jgi:hypothetical protein
MRANPAVEVGVQNAEVTTHDSGNATLSNITTAQLQDLHSTVMAAIQAESCKQTADIQSEVSKLTETLKVQLSQVGEKLAASLTESFEAANAKFREELNGKLQQEIQGVSGKVDKLKRDTDHSIDNFTKSVGNLGEELSSGVNAHIVQTRKELDKQGQEIINGSKVISSNIREHKAETESSDEKLRQAMTQSREQVNDRFKEMSGDVRSSIQECENKIQIVKQANESEIMRINKAISSLEAKFTAKVATNNKATIPQTAACRPTAVGQTESTVGIVGSEPSVNGVNGTNTCEMSSCSDGANVPIASHKSCNSNVNAGSGLYANNADLSELTLATFTDSTSQVPLHFIRDLDQYFSLK